MNHEEEEFPIFRDDLLAFFHEDQGNYTSWDYLGYLVELDLQSNNDTTGPRLINNMVFPHIRLSEKKIKNFKWGNITLYLIFEGLDVIGHATLLTDVNVSLFAQPTDGVWLEVWHHRQLQYFYDLNQYEVLLATTINNEI